jgi:hypothetical protein
MYFLSGNSHISTCNDASRVNIIIGVQKQDNLEAAGDYIKSEFSNEIFYKNSKIYKNYYKNYSKKYNEKDENLYNSFGFSNIIKDNLSKKCWNEVDRAVDLEYENLILRHAKSFSEKFSEVCKL